MKIEFVSYDGHFPNLCSGNLVVKIDGIEHTFGGYSQQTEENHYPQFWESGGGVSFDDDWNEFVSHGEWELSYPCKEDFPPEIYILLPEILKVMNDNVRRGCCGGCV